MAKLRPSYIVLIIVTCNYQPVVMTICNCVVLGTFPPRNVESEVVPRPKQHTVFYKNDINYIIINLSFKLTSEDALISS